MHCQLQSILQQQQVQQLGLVAEQKSGGERIGLWLVRQLNGKSCTPRQLSFTFVHDRDANQNDASKEDHLNKSCLKSASKTR
ncbi:hypothetical protein TYRP_015426 [Tyrophagus putrescentiae]|nr:hypothetical protein TYRP_015426 [Tyrophagus putrescentiae]